MLRPGVGGPRKHFGSEHRHIHIAALRHRLRERRHRPWGADNARNKVYASCRDLMQREHGAAGRRGCVAAGNHPHHRRKQAWRVDHKPCKAGAALGAVTEGDCCVVNRHAVGLAKSRGQRLERAGLGAARTAAAQRARRQPERCWRVQLWR